MNVLDNPILAEHAAEIRRLGTRIVTDVIEIGRRLAEAKEIAGHGNWLPWLSREFSWSVSTAENYVNLFRLSGKFPTVGNLDLDLRSLYLLAAPSTPPEARDEIIARAEAGEPITVTTVKSAIAKTKPAPEPESEKPKLIHGVNAACATLFENEDQLHAFSHAVNTPTARRFISVDQQPDLAKQIIKLRVRGLGIPVWVTHYVREASKAQGKIDAEETDDLYKQFPGYEIRDEVAAAKSAARSLDASLLKLEELAKKFPGNPFFGDIGSTLDAVINMIRQYRRAAREDGADQIERKLARLQELEHKTRTQAITIEELRSEIEDLKSSKSSSTTTRGPRPPPPNETLARLSALIAGCGESAELFVREALVAYARQVIASGTGDIKTARKVLAKFGEAPR